MPNWFGVAVPGGASDFSRVNLFFHPTPGQAGFRDTDYPTKAGKWPQLFYYMALLGFQMAGASRNQIVIMPFLTEAAISTWILPANWKDLVTDILTQVRAQMNPGDTSPFALAQVVVSSFSAGIVYSHAFRQSAPGLAGLLAEIWDFDGSFSSFANDSAALRSKPPCSVIQYDQNPNLGSTSFHVPSPRWAGYYDKATMPKTAGQVHGRIRDFMFLHAGSISTVGATIGAPAPAPGPPVQGGVPPAPGSVSPAPASVPVPIMPAPVPVPGAPAPAPGPLPAPMAPAPGSAPVPVPMVPVPTMPVPSVPVPTMPVPGPVPVATLARPEPPTCPPPVRDGTMQPQPAVQATPVPCPCDAGTVVTGLAAMTAQTAGSAITAITAIARGTS